MNLVLQCEGRGKITTLQEEFFIMNKKVLVSLAAVATVTFTSLGAVSTDAACNNKQYTQYKKYQQFQCFTKEDVLHIQNSLCGLNTKPSCNVQQNTDCQKPEVQAPETESTTPDVQAPELEGTTPEVQLPEADNSTEITNPSEDKEDVSTSTEVSAFEQEVFELTNAERVKAGLSPFTLDTELSKVARIKSQDMKDNNYFSHTSPTYGSPFDMMKAFGISYKSAAENIAQGQKTPEEVVQAWMNSQGHRENILNANYTHIGIGHVSDNNYWTQMFIGK